MSEKNRCLECHSLTANPKFCGRSCAAKFNNRKSPKRSPEGTCGDCGVAISASRSYCPECREKRQHSSTTTPVQMREVTVFTASSMSLPADSRVGAFLDVFESLAQSQPRYLPSSDWTRHVQFVQLVRKFSHELPGYRSQSNPCFRGRLPIELIGMGFTAVARISREYINSTSAGCNLCLGDVRRVVVARPRPPTLGY